MERRWLDIASLLFAVVAIVAVGAAVGVLTARYCLSSWDALMTCQSLVYTPTVWP